MQSYLSGFVKYPIIILLKIQAVKLNILLHIASFLNYFT